MKRSLKIFTVIAALLIPMVFSCKAGAAVSGDQVISYLKSYQEKEKGYVFKDVSVMLPIMRMSMGAEDKAAFKQVKKLYFAYWGECSDDVQKSFESGLAEVLKGRTRTTKSENDTEMTLWTKEKSLDDSLTDPVLVMLTVKDGQILKLLIYIKGTITAEAAESIGN